MTKTILISGGAGYIGSAAAYALRQGGYAPVIIDDLSRGHAWATKFGAFEQGDIGDVAFVRAVCRKHAPIAAMHFAAFIEVEESVKNPTIYFENNSDKAVRFFDTLNECGINKIVFSSSAAVYGNAATDALISELSPPAPLTPYGQSKLEAETELRALDSAGMRSVVLRYFNVAGAAPESAMIGEAHRPESHLIPRLLLPLLPTPPDILHILGLDKGFAIYGTDYPTPDGTAIRDYVHVMDIVDAHKRALTYLLGGGKSDIFNFGGGSGFSVAEIVNTTRQILNKPTYTPRLAPRRIGDPARLVASHKKAAQILGWKPQYSLKKIITDAARWHASPLYHAAIREPS